MISDWSIVHFAGGSLAGTGRLPATAPRVVKLEGRGLMNLRLRSWVLGLALLGASCSTDEKEPEPTGSTVSYWQDVAPIFEQRCLSCHQEGGLGPFRLDDYETAKAHAAGI